MNFQYNASSEGSPGETGGKRGLPIWLRLVIAVASVLLLTFGAWYASFGIQWRATEITPTPRTTPAEIAVGVTAMVGNSFSEQPPVLPVSFIEVETEASVSVDRPGDELEGLARGDIEIVNDGSASQVLIATTRLISSDGIMFRLDERVTVPARGRVSTKMTADQLGSQGDVPPGQFSIPGLSIERQKFIYGQTSRPTSGGLTSTGEIFGQADLASLRALIASQASKSLVSLIESGTTSGTLVALDQMEIKEVRFAEVPVVGQPTGSFTARATVYARAPSVNLKYAETLLLKELTSRAQGGAYSLGSVNFYLVEDGSERTVVLKSVAYLKP